MGTLIKCSLASKTAEMVELNLNFQCLFQPHNIKETKQKEVKITQ